MRVIYQDEYGNPFLASESCYVPRPGDLVVLGDPDEEFQVKHVMWDAMLQIATLTVGEPSINRAEKVVDNSGRLNEMNRAIVNLTERADVSAKKGRMQGEELVSVRTAIKSLAKAKPKQES